MSSVISRELTPAPAPLEPKLAYPKPLLSAELLALIRGNTFFAALLQGDVLPPGAPNVGLFHADTRFLSQLELRVNGHQAGVLSSTTIGSDISRIDLTARGEAASGENLDLPVTGIYIRREQLLENDRFYETLDIQSFNNEEVKLTLELLFDADFMDIFQVRGLLRGTSGQYFVPQVKQDAVRFYYEGLDERSRTTDICFSPAPHRLESKRAVWSLTLPPRGRQTILTTVAMTVGMPGEENSGRAACHGRTFENAWPKAICDQDAWTANCTRFRSDNEIFDVMLQTSTEDFYSLRMHGNNEAAIAAGVPWFAALFGRDSLLSSFETLILDPDLARGTLRVLAAYQGKQSNDERDEDPGKILHERRSGEMTNTNEVAFGRSYGSVDSTPLFLFLARAYVQWTGDTALLVELHGALKGATEWILNYGDLDGDGLIEYQRRNPKGLFNQGWKDSGDAIRHKDGSIAEPPIALVEVQGYAVRALADAAEMLASLGDHELAAAAKEKSEQLRRLIDERFWDEDRVFYGLALDREKNLCRVDSSNPGHLLFAQAIDAKRARQVSDRVLEAGLFSGWGIRTLSSEEQSYNPMSYHCGSVWPHDNALIGYGMALYGLHREACNVFHSLYDAALQFRDYRLPELFCGFTRQQKGEPVHYPVSCSPQAWAAGAPFLLLTGLLGITPNAAAGELAIIDPHLPPFLRKLRIENLRVGASRITLDFQRQGDRTHCNVVDVQGEQLKISILFRPPAKQRT
ncbi:MAG TPA: glycogen debranching N-terminal domain-containing protein [Acidobacteriaceae bacterium]|jgi:glycogen debranching enzyme|nr:glycogen debranching N-terminal domain-containing protein [Acidobacteriaceae bacterium]